MAFRILRPDRTMTRDAAVTGTVDAEHRASWLCDMRTGFPVRSEASGSSPDLQSLSLTVAGTSRVCDFVATTHLKIDDDSDIVLSAGISATLSVRGAGQADGIPLNRWTTIDPVTAAGCTVSVVDHPGPVVIGELFVGLSDTLARPLFLGAEHSFQRFAIDPQSEFSSLNPYAKGLAGELLSGLIVVTDDELEDLKQAIKSSDDGALPLVIVPDDTVDLCMVVQVLDMTWRDRAPGDADSLEPTQQALYDVTLSFREYPRSRW